MISRNVHVLCYDVMCRYMRKEEASSLLVVNRTLNIVVAL